mmetsp:Transcript_125868/g.361958  ORF Transcript_125868/g.361958 Transcript_125868/m.361958 type:complete len:267 (-) Transcript_125868:2154-2954(-)
MPVSSTISMATPSGGVGLPPGSGATASGLRCKAASKMPPNCGASCAPTSPQPLPLPSAAKRTEVRWQGWAPSSGRGPTPLSAPEARRKLGPSAPPLACSLWRSWPPLALRPLVRAWCGLPSGCADPSPLGRSRPLAELRPPVGRFWGLVGEWTMQLRLVSSSRSPGLSMMSTTASPPTPRASGAIAAPALRRGEESLFAPGPCSTPTFAAAFSAACSTPAFTAARSTSACTAACSTLAFAATCSTPALPAACSTPAWWLCAGCPAG